MSARVAKLGAAAGAALGGTVLFAPAADAATFTVTNLDDTGEGSLRDAVEDANAAAGADDVIVFQAGLSGAITLASVIPVGEGVEIQGPGAGVITVSGDDATQIFYVKTDLDGEPGEQVTISGLTLTKGDSGSTGGAIEALRSALTLSEVVLTDNHAGFTGGAVSANFTSLNILSSTVSGNSAVNTGGGIYRDDNPYGAEVIRDSVFTGNSSERSGGAIGLYDSYDAPVSIENVTIAGNHADSRGGGIQLYDWEVDTPVTIANSTITGNDATLGGGIHMYTNIAAGTPSPVTVRNTTISGNRADYGGGIRFGPLDDSTPVVINSTITGNTAYEEGGGVYVADYPDGNGPATLSSVIVAGNTAPIGNDLGGDEDGDGFDSEGFEIGFSLIGDLNGAPVVEQPAGSNLTGVDPQLGPLQNNGGPTETHAPAVGSPAVDMGVANALPADQRGAQRTFDAANLANAAGGDGTDIGAVELLPGGRLSLASCKGATENLLFAPGTAIVGTDANDVIVGTDAADNINSGKGKDKVCAGGGNDAVKAGSGKDNVAGQAGKDRLKGNGGNDKLQGNAGKDTLKGGGGKDTLKGGGGKDKLRGGPGKDKLKGGGGKDSEVQ